MHSGFANLRSALPMNIKAHYPGFKVWLGAQADIDRVTAVWRECLSKYRGSYLFGDKPCAADAMYAPVCTRFMSYDVKLDSTCAAYCNAIMTMPFMDIIRELAPDATQQVETITGAQREA